MKFTFNLGNVIFNNWLGWLTVFIITVPSLIFFFGFLTSLALGGVLDCIIIVLIASHCASNIIRAVLWGGGLIILVGINLCMASLVLPIDTERALFSLPLIALGILSAFSIASSLKKVSDISINRAVKLVLVCMSIIAFAYLIGFKLVEDGRPKSMFPFVEPAHFAIALFPFLLYSCLISSQALRFITILLVLLLSIAVENLTLLVECIIVIFLTLENRKLLFCCLFLLPIFLLQFDLSYFYSRINISQSSDNLSALVYLQGWELIIESFQKTKGIGLGFQQLGFTSTDVPASKTIELLAGESLNLRDGGFLLSKLLSEFGWLGVVLLTLYINIAIKSLNNLRKTAKARVVSGHATVISECFIVSAIIELFVRGSGYFTHSLLFAVAGIIYMHGNCIKSNKCWNYAKN